MSKKVLLVDVPQGSVKLQAVKRLQMAQHISTERAEAVVDKSYITTAKHSSTARAVAEADQRYGTTAEHSIASQQEQDQR